MRWRGRRQSSNVEDRRGQSRGRGGFGRLGRRAGRRSARIGLPGGRRSRGGGLGIGGIIVIGVLAWAFGINPLQLLGGLDGGGTTTQLGPQPSRDAGRTVAPSDDGGQFIATVLADTEDTWHRIFNAGGETYVEPTLVLFTSETSSACGFASSATGPFYCPGDQKVYIDLEFYDLLSNRFEAPGDFAEAYVIAHEIGHHVQNIFGVLSRVNEQKRRVSTADANQLSIMVELQADCYAGIWAKESERIGAVEDGDIDEALVAAAAVGDDTIQRRTQGYVVPESFNHGTAEQRARWFKRGYLNGSVQGCDTFSAAQL